MHDLTTGHVHAHDHGIGFKTGQASPRIGGGWLPQVRAVSPRGGGSPSLLQCTVALHVSFFPTFQFARSVSLTYAGACPLVAEGCISAASSICTYVLCVCVPGDSRRWPHRWSN
ncbi:unnamed protein product [Discosporangium mesarthrocarpum]